MTTKIADIIIPEVFNPYVIERTAELSALFQSGIVETDPQFDELARSGGRLLNMPFYKDLTGDDEVLSDSLALTPDKIGTEQDVAVLLMRGKAWGVNDLAKALSGDDPMRAIGDLVARYWARRQQQILISTLKGVFASASMANAVKDISIEDGNNAADTNLISAEAILDAMQLLGDASEKLTAIAMHSVVYTRLRKLNLIDFIPDSRGEINFPTYLDKRVIVDDSLPVEAGSTSGYKYTTYLFGAGAFAYGEGNPPVPTEVDRDSLAGEDYLINRRHFILHPRGVKFTDTNVAGSSPTNAELADADNWTRVYEQKNVRLVKLVTNG